MDADRFDRLSKILAAGLPRRSLLRVLTGGAAAVLVGTSSGGRALAANDASAFCKQLPPGQRGRCRSDAANGNEQGLFAQCEGDPDRLCQAPNGSFACCGTDEDCCAGACIPATACCTADDCPAPTAPCQGERTCIGGDCGFLPAPANTPCRTATCANGEATAAAVCDGQSTVCPPAITRTCSPYVCDATGTACAQTCGDDAECVAGAHCDAPACLPDEGLGAHCDEDSDCQSGVCVGNLCCAQACPPPPNAVATCVDGGLTCEYACAQGYTSCNGACISAEACCTECPICQTCADGECGPDASQDNTACGDGRACCGGACVDVTSEPNCGSCGTICQDPRICVEGRCCQPILGGACTQGGGCCWGLCDGGTCRLAVPGEPCDTHADCASSNCIDEVCQEACIGLGDSCSEADDCCQDEPTFCEVVSGPIFGSVCCHQLTGTCESYTECCQDSAIGFIDCEPAQGCCLAVQSLCDPLNDLCCRQGGHLSCSYGANSSTQQGEARCCVDNGGICAFAINCCDNLDCQNNRCCGGAGDVNCFSDDECCDGVVCRGNVCCFPEGTACDFDSECCAGSTCQNGVCTRVCLPIGDNCTAEDCCEGGATCFDGVCRPCQQGSAACFDGLSTTAVCCEPPGAALLCCETHSTCDTEHCQVFCVAEEPVDCDVAQTLCPATYPIVIGLAGHVTVGVCNSLPAGASCQVDTDCVTAVCIDGICQQTSTGGPCGDHDDCTTGNCNGGICQP